ncbi:alkaline phosphatase family protein, partial [Acinetobacter baumannii]
CNSKIPGAELAAATGGDTTVTGPTGVPVNPASLRGPGSLPDPTRPAGVADDSLPFDHIVIVMMENHSFDNYLGMLPIRGQPLADGF